MRRAALASGALACLAAAALLLLLAADVSRWEGAFAAGDVRYRVAPAERDLWEPAQLVPLEAAAGLLQVEDDVALRRALRAFRLARVDDTVVSDPAIQLLRGDARTRLRALAEDGREDAARRSRALGLLGVLSFASALTEVQDRATLLLEAAATYRQAIAVDPGNGEAKRNLEVALQRSRGLQATSGSGGPNPRPGGPGSRGAGAGDPGSGY